MTLQQKDIDFSSMVVNYSEIQKLPGCSGLANYLSWNLEIPHAVWLISSTAENLSAW